MKPNCLIILFLFLFGTMVGSSQGHKVHSHNDYEQQVPFWKAVSAGVASLEADVFLQHGNLLVAHELESTTDARTLKRLYLEPLNEALDRGLLNNTPLQLLIDIKSEAVPTLEALITALREYPSIIKSTNVSIVISGNRPEIAQYVTYPDFISFDYQTLDPIEDASIRDKVGLISLPFTRFTAWNGKGRLTKEDLERVTAVVEKAHSFGKPFRFWATPDSKTAWKAMVDLGVDYINTDHPYACVTYVHSLPERVYENTEKRPVYVPKFERDGAEEHPKNIILMIGDGNGLAQISATALANGGALSLTQLKHIGLVKTQSSDDFTTDSAGAATAMATGVKVPNRAIGVNADGVPITNLVEQLSGAGFKTVANLEGIKTGSTTRTGAFFPTDTGPAPLDSALKNVLFNFEQKKAPFFLVVEGAKIDSYGHANNIGGLVEEALAFDKAVGEAIQFADQNKNTLVIITADHETGGLTLPQGNVASGTIEADFTTEEHTVIFVPLFAYGPQSHTFQGVFENTAVFEKIVKALNTTPTAK